MKERILDFLIKLSAGKESDVLPVVMKNTGLSGDQVRKNAKIVIGKILHQYSQFSVSTIDAFFQKIVKSFAKELGLLGNFKVELDQDKVKQEIIDQLIEELGTNNEITDWLVDFSFSKVDDNKSWNIRPQIETLANEVFKESFRPVSEQLSLINQHDFRSFLNQIKKIKTEFEKNIKSKAHKALEYINSNGLGIDDFAYKASGPAGYFNNVLKDNFEPGKRLRQALENPELWYAKASPKKNEIRSYVDAGLKAIASDMVNYYDSHFIKYNTANEVQKNIYVFGILSQIIKKLKVYRQEHDIMLISDVPIFLNGIIAENETPFIYEKTGTWYQNYLIDEFQDTSEYQWQNFKPLVENGLALGNKSLMVGDGKQSIYRWRGGNWNLILNKVRDDLQLFSPEEKYLDTNWRSARKIIEFNNAVFSHLPALLEGNFRFTIEGLSIGQEEKHQLNAKVFDVVKLYEDVSQKVAEKNKTPSKGRIEINAFLKSEEQNWKQSSLEELPKTIEQLQESGIQAKDIAVLVRKGDEGKQVIEQLINYKKSKNAKTGICYDAISNESLFLGNSSAIRIIINTITYCLNPEDKIAYGEICFNYKYIQDNQDADDDLSYILKGESLPADFQEVCEKLILLPAYEMIERIIQLFQLGSSQQKGYLQAFQDVVLDYFSNEKKDINDFLEWWNDKGKRKSIQLPDSINAIQVMTIHKSKGLEFKAVLIPFCDWKLDHDATKANFLWCKTTNEPYNEIGYMPVKYSSSLASSYFAQDYFDEMIKAHIDNLNLLYVALTRAEDFLLINCPPSGKEIKTAGDLVNKGLENYLSEHVEGLDISISEYENKVFYSLGTIGLALSNQSNEPAPFHGSYQSSDWREKIALRKKGGIFFTEGGAEKKAKINYGLIVHEILASIKNQDEADIALERYYLEGQISKKDKQTLTDQLRQIFSNSKVKLWFNSNWEVKAEASIIIKNKHPKRPDRVLIHDNNAIIIDFKTGMEKSADIRQILSYKETLLEMGFLNVEAHLLYIALNKVIQVS